MVGKDENRPRARKPQTAAVAASPCQADTGRLRAVAKPSLERQAPGTSLGAIGGEANDLTLGELNVSRRSVDPDLVFRPISEWLDAQPAASIATNNPIFQPRIFDMSCLRHKLIVSCPELQKQTSLSIAPA